MKGTGPSNATMYIVAAVLFILLIIIVALPGPGWPASGPGQSIHDGEWTIIFTNCQGITKTYDDCRVLDINDTFVTFTTAGRSREIKLPIVSACSSIVMERER